MNPLVDSYWLLRFVIMTLQFTYDNKGRKIGVFIPIGEWKKFAKKYKELDSYTADSIPSKEEVLKSIKEGLDQAKLHHEGKLALKTAQQLLDEL